MLYRDFIREKLDRFELTPKKMSEEYREMFYDFLEYMNDSDPTSPYKTSVCATCRYARNTDSPYACDGCRKGSGYAQKGNGIDVTKSFYKKWANSIYGRGNGKTLLTTSNTEDFIKRWAIFKGYGQVKPLRLDEIKDVIFNDPATIVFWTDGTKTVVKCQNGEQFDPEKGLAMAISKRALGNCHEYYEVFNKYVGRYNKKRRNKK